MPDDIFLHTLPGNKERGLRKMLSQHIQTHEVVGMAMGDQHMTQRLAGHVDIIGQVFSFCRIPQRVYQEYFVIIDQDIAVDISRCSSEYFYLHISFF